MVIFSPEWRNLHLFSRENKIYRTKKLFFLVEKTKGGKNLFDLFLFLKKTYMIFNLKLLFVIIIIINIYKYNNN